MFYTNKSGSFTIRVLSCRFYFVLCEKSDCRDRHEANARRDGAYHSGAVSERGFELLSHLLYIKSRKSGPLLALFDFICSGLEEFCAFVAEKHCADKPHYNYCNNEEKIILRRQKVFGYVGLHEKCIEIKY